MPESGVSWAEKVVAAYGRGLIRWRWLVLVASLAVGALAVAGIGRLEFAIDYRYETRRRV